MPRLPGFRPDPSSVLTTGVMVNLAECMDVTTAGGTGILARDGAAYFPTRPPDIELITHGQDAHASSLSLFL
jgi:hypothetical protein